MTWRVRDFWLAMFAGLALAALGAVAVTAVGGGASLLIVVSALAQYLGHLGCLWLQGRNRGGLESLGLEIRPGDVRYLFLGVLLQLLVPILFYPLANLVSEGDGGQIVSEQIRQLSGVGVRAVMAAVVTMLAPLTEELLFRGALQRSLSPGRKAIWIPAVLFALFHVFGLSGDLLRSLVLTMPTFIVIGLVLSYVTARQKRLGPAIFVHSGFNLLALVVLFLPPELLEEAIQAR